MLLTDKRVVLIGGKGGVGKTTVSSALALLAARRGKKTLIVSTDPAHSLGDAFDRTIGDTPVRLADHLDGVEIDPDKAVRQHIETVSADLKKFTSPEMFSQVERQMRLTQQSPGAQEAALLERIARILDKQLNNYDLILFDTAPTGHTLRLLTLPEAMAAWTQGLLKHDSRSRKLAGVLDHLTPKAGKDITNPMAGPEEPAGAGLDKRARDISERLLQRQRLFQRTRRLLQDHNQTSLMFVLTPEKLPILETQRAVTALAEENLPLAGLVVNRVLPDSADGTFLARRRTQESVYLKQIDELFVSLKRHRLPLQSTDIVGLAALKIISDELAATGL